MNASKMQGGQEIVVVIVVVVAVVFIWKILVVPYTKAAFLIVSI